MILSTFLSFFLYLAFVVTGFLGGAVHASTSSNDSSDFFGQSRVVNFHPIDLQEISEYLFEDLLLEVRRQPSPEEKLPTFLDCPPDLFPRFLQFLGVENALPFRLVSRAWYQLYHEFSLPQSLNFISPYFEEHQLLGRNIGFRATLLSLSRNPNFISQTTRLSFSYFKGLTEVLTVPQELPILALLNNNIPLVQSSLLSFHNGLTRNHSLRGL